jgi:chromosome segregation ATPase
MICPLHQITYSVDGICAQCLAAAFTQQRELMNALQSRIADHDQVLADLRAECQDLRRNATTLAESVDRLHTERLHHLEYIDRLEQRVTALDHPR